MQKYHKSGIASQFCDNFLLKTLGFVKYLKN